MSARESSSLTVCDRVYKNIINSTVQRHYRADLQKEAVTRASAIKRSQKPVKAQKASKPRGKKAITKAE